MIEVILHDVEAGTAVIQVVSGGVTLTDTYDLSRVFPGTKEVLQTLGIPFDLNAQLKAIEFLGQSMERQMADGSMVGDPIYTPKEEVESPEKPVPVKVWEAPETESVVPMELPEQELTVAPGPAPEIDKAARAAAFEAEAKTQPVVKIPTPQKPVPVVEDAFEPPVPDVNNEPFEE